MTLADIPDVLDALGQLFGPGGVDSSQPSQASRLAPDRPYRSSPTKRGRRRSNADMQTIRDAIQAVVNEHAPVTVRQVFYQLVTQGVIDKTEAEYKGTICRLLVMMRRDGSIEYHDIADNTRWQRKPRSHESLQHFLKESQRLYRRDLWDSQNAYVEVWLEKEALAGVLYDVTSDWDVPLMVTRGYPSLSFLHSAGEQIADTDKPVYLYYFGDHDPSGADISRTVERELRQFAPDTDITFQRVAVVEGQNPGIQSADQADQKYRQPEQKLPGRKRRGRRHPAGHAESNVPELHRPTRRRRRV